jgi:hypothetical protein
VRWRGRSQRARNCRYTGSVISPSRLRLIPLRRRQPTGTHSYKGCARSGTWRGRTSHLNTRSAHDQPELFPKFALELANLKVEVIFARGTWALAAAKNATRTIPIVGIDLEVDLRVKSARLTHLCHCSMSSLLAAFCSIASVSVVTSADAHAARQTAPDAGERS